MYATSVLRDRFPEGEEAIMADPVYGPLYQKELDSGYFEHMKERREQQSAV
jgi:hypothetical protein